MGVRATSQFVLKYYKIDHINFVFIFFANIKNNQIKTPNKVSLFKVLSIQLITKKIFISSKILKISL